MEKNVFTRASLYLYRTRKVRAAGQTEAGVGRSARCHCARNAGQYLHQRPAYQARQRASRRTGRYGRPRNGGYRRTSRPGRHFDQARRPGNGQCRNFLRRVLFLQARVCEQLCRSGRRLGVRLPYRRRPGRVRARAPCRSGIEPYSRHGRRRTGAFRRRHSGHGFLGRPDLGNRRRGHGAYYRRRAYGHLYPALRHAPASETHHRLRKVARTNPFRARALSRSAGLRARGMPAFRIPPQRSRRSRQSARSGGSGRYVPSGMGMPSLP